MDKAGMTGCNSVKYPMEPMDKLGKDKQGRTVLFSLVRLFPLIHKINGGWSQVHERPTELHLAAVKHILRYVNGTLDFGLIYTKFKGNYLLTVYSNSDLAGNMDDRKSTRDCILLKLYFGSKISDFSVETNENGIVAGGRSRSPVLIENLPEKMNGRSAVAAVGMVMLLVESRTDWGSENGRTKA
ncbi:uncharacterized protein LOC141701645 [Apium graveolens]|uniref:uncharacterized protein LOC141701645 n=1 Tax=Apium graveolens TaxID=4045 RepID=UPI003D792A1B